MRCLWFLERRPTRSPRPAPHRRCRAPRLAQQPSICISSRVPSSVVALLVLPAIHACGPPDAAALGGERVVAQGNGCAGVAARLVATADRADVAGAAAVGGGRAPGMHRCRATDRARRHAAAAELAARSTAVPGRTTQGSNENMRSPRPRARVRSAPSASRARLRYSPRGPSSKSIASAIRLPFGPPASKLPLTPGTDSHGASTAVANGLRPESPAAGLRPAALLPAPVPVPVLPPPVVVLLLMIAVLLTSPSVPSAIVITVPSARSGDAPTRSATSMHSVW